MAQDPRIIIDTDIIIKIFRGDKEKRRLLEPIQDELALSVITAMELMNGTKTRKREYEVSKSLKAYHLFPLTAVVGVRSFMLVKKYHLLHNISIADALIAAAAIEHNLPLYTDILGDTISSKSWKCIRPNNEKKVQECDATMTL